MSDKALSQSRISTYAKCQRLYEFTYDWEVNVVDEQRRYIDRGNVLHSVIQNVCNCVGRGLNLEDSEIRQLAIDLINTYWDERMDRSEYYSDAEFEEDRLATVARIEAFLITARGSSMYGTPLLPNCMSPSSETVRHIMAPSTTSSSTTEP